VAKVKKAMEGDHRTGNAVVSPEGLESAKSAGLRYVSDHDRGIHRVRRGKSFSYVDFARKPVKGAETLHRIHSLVIPPAWEQVWICPDASGHIQAVGVDQRGRKQYRYHPRWREVRDETKYEHLVAFGKKLPKIRRQVQRDMRAPGLPREKVVATVIRLLETTLIRVGNEEYAKENHSFGLTTMHDKHVAVKAGSIHFEFRGKSGVQHAIDLQDRKLAKIIRSCQHLPGHELFQYVDAQDTRHTISSDDVNDYLHATAGNEFTAKDFRTWAGTVLAAMALQEFERFDSEAQAKRNLVAAIESVAKKLGNTKTVCRKCYIHPAVMSGYLDGTLVESLKREVERNLKTSLHGLRPEEAAVLAMLQERLARETKRDAKTQKASAHTTVKKGRAKPHHMAA
jgi:DNA topoisomerase-1